MSMGGLRRYSTLIALTLSLAGSSGFVACGSSDSGHNQGPPGTGGDAGFDAAGGATSGGSGGGGTGGTSTGGGGTGGTGTGGDAATSDVVTSNGDAADGAG